MSLIQIKNITTDAKNYIIKTNECTQIPESFLWYQYSNTSDNIAVNVKLFGNKECTGVYNGDYKIYHEFSKIDDISSVPESPIVTNNLFDYLKSGISYII